jgi:hypothetical protein
MYAGLTKKMQKSNWRLTEKEIRALKYPHQALGF